MNPEARVEQLDKALTLTAEQKAKITKIYQDIQAAPQEERRAKMQGAHDQIRAVLNADQQKKFDALPQGGGDGKGGGKKKKDQ
jgi:Spy/CpxP family protein refolding chaperone